jgi:hypothetical protein
MLGIFSPSLLGESSLSRRRKKYFPRRGEKIEGENKKVSVWRSCRVGSLAHTRWSGGRGHLRRGKWTAS